MRGTITAVTLALLVGVLYITNPTTEDFARRYADEANAELTRDLGLTGDLGNLLGGFSQTLIQEALEQQTRRDNYLLASVFTIPTADEDVRVLGLAGQFISLN